MKAGKEFARGREASKAKPKSRKRRATYPRVAGESNQRLVCIQRLAQASKSEMGDGG